MALNLRKTCLVTGASGLLGKNLIPLMLKYNIVSPNSKVLDITCEKCVTKFFINNQVDLVVHLAAYTDVKKAENDFMKCNLTNVIGTYNILNEVVKRNIKIVYLSTDAVFDGERGDYKTSDPLNPVSKYAKSKTAAELLVRTYENSLIIRTSFFGQTFPYDKAFIDQWSTKDYIDVMAPKILEAIYSDNTGIIHVFSVKRSLYELAKIRKKNVIPCNLRALELNYKIPKDLSLNKE